MTLMPSTPSLARCGRDQAPSDGRLVKGRIGLQRERDSISNDEPCRQLLEVARGHERIDLVLQDTHDIVAVLGDQLSRDEKGSGVVDAIHIAWIASINSRFHRAATKQSLAEARLTDVIQLKTPVPC
jgi:hypothetical protein